MAQNLVSVFVVFMTLWMMSSAFLIPHKRAPAYEESSRPPRLTGTLPRVYDQYAGSLLREELHQIEKDLRQIIRNEERVLGAREMLVRLLSQESGRNDKGVQDYVESADYQIKRK